MLLLSLLAGCPYITSADHQARTDADGDGVLWTDDCDDGDPLLGEESTWYGDADGDGYGSDDAAIVACLQPSGTSELGGDCDDTDADQQPGQQWFVDLDGDGWASSSMLSTGCVRPEGASHQTGDCDDDEDTVHPDAVELCDGLDNDCNELIDDGAEPIDWYYDGDGDGYGSDEVTLVSCTPPAGYASLGGDCDDEIAAINPGAQEQCSGQDDDCDGLVDAADPSMEGEATWYRDADGDGYGVATDTTTSCSRPVGYSRDAGDCDDGDADVNPGTLWYVDDDGDGYGDPSEFERGCAQPEGTADNADDCDDADADRNPDSVWYLDADGDGYGLDGATVTGCEQPSGYAARGGDCNDHSSTRNPDTVWYRDADGDGYGDEDRTTTSCEQPSGYVGGGGDCDDTSVRYSPDAEESDCSDPEDYNCDGVTGYTDGDGDGWAACEECDDSDRDVHPGASDVWYDGVDSDCEGDDDYDADGDGDPHAAYTGTDCDDADPDTWYGAPDSWYDGVDSDCDGRGDYDADGDGYDADAYGGDDCDDRAPAVSPGVYDAWYDGLDADCDGASDYDADRDGEDSDAWGGDDCDDGDPAVRPDARETWYDGVDADCGGGSDYDADGDGDDALAWGGGDCDDADPAVHSGAVETWYDGVDSDCDRISDYDADLDGMDSVVWGGSDCDDSDASVHPGATEVWYDGVDGDCDGASDDDADGDGHDVDVDCDDGARTVHPGASDTWYDGVDSDCDGASDFDADGDGYDAELGGGSDCDDTTADVSPAAVEVCDNLIDDDCDGGPGECQLAGDYVLGLDVGIRLIGETSSDKAGHSVAFAGDVDGDGQDDLLVGAYQRTSGASSRAGTAYLVLGPVTSDTDLADATAALVGSNDNFYAGTSVAAGDWDGDGYADIVVGAPFRNHGLATGGGAAVFGGPVTGTLDVATDADFLGYGDDESNDEVGASVVMSADLDGDGRLDLMVGGPGYDGLYADSGSVFVFRGPASGTLAVPDADFVLSGTSSSDDAGNSVDVAGDVDGDGNADIVVGAPRVSSWGFYSGQAYVLFGPLSSSSVDLGDSDAVLDGEGSTDFAGTAVAGAGDVDGDGYDDVLISAPGGSTWGSGGTVYLLYGPPASGDLGAADGFLAAAGTSDDLADSVDGAGDVDGDGFDDVLVGTSTGRFSGTTYGGAWLTYGPIMGTVDLASPDASFRGGSSGDGAGISVAGGGDVNGDLRPDLLIGAHAADTGGSDSGEAFLILGTGL